MAKKTITHKGYHGSILIDNSDYSLFGKILFIDEDFSYRGESFTELEANFQQRVEEHILTCQEKGEDPPF